MGIGMGGRISRPRPRWRPVRMVSLKFRTVHLPRPVSRSGVRLAVKLTPQGPDHAVFVAANAFCHGPSAIVGAGGITRVSGCPDNMRSMSGAGPVGVILSGVWQSLQPVTVTRYRPRAWASLATAAAGGSPARAKDAATTRAILTNIFRE